MNSKNTLEVYDRNYAKSYNHRFLSEERKTLDELSIIKYMLDRKSMGSWLDIACGTGFYLSQFSNHENRMGLDLSPDMLMIAKELNPQVEFVNTDFKNAEVFEENRFDIITSLWWAYSFAESLNDIAKFIDNIKKWLKQDGICFVPIGNVSRNLLLSEHEIFPFYTTHDAPIYGGTMRMDAAIWTYIEPNGKEHKEMIIPHPEKMKEMFLERFKHVNILTYANGIYCGIIASEVEFKSNEFLIESRFDLLKFRESLNKV